MKIDPKNIIFVGRELIVDDELAVNKLLELLGYNPAEVFVSDESHLSDFTNMFGTTEERQAEIDAVLPVPVYMRLTFAEAITIIRQSLPNWPAESKLQ